jgi:outer membrane lipopolysaccharide assembly protein LptE/RlpB
MNGRIVFVIVGMLSLVTAGCGYRFQGATLPDPTIEVPLFENNTIETGIETLVTERVLSELRRTPGWRIVPPGHGRYILRGEIRTFVSDPQTLTRRHLAVENRARMILRVSLRDRVKDTTLWTEQSFRSFSDYPLTGDILANEREKLAAIARIADKLATRIRVRIQDTW